MTRAALLLPAFALALAACDPAPEPASAPEAPAAEPRLLGGVDLDQPLRALGTEPFWGVDITPERITYSGVDRPEQSGPNPGPVIQGTTAVWTANVGDTRVMVVTLMATECSDGMSDRVYPLTARVEIGEETLNGCAASSAWIMSTGEGGQSAEAAPAAPATAPAPAAPAA